MQEWLERLWNDCLMLYELLTELVSPRSGVSDGSTCLGGEYKIGMDFGFDRWFGDLHLIFSSDWHKGNFFVIEILLPFLELLI